MKKFIRLTKEFFSSIVLYENFLTYLRVRFGMVKGVVVIRLRNGIKYSIHGDSSEIRVINEIWSTKVYDLLLHYVHDGSTVIDIGANIGVFSIKAARAAKNVRVFSYEPFPQSYAALQSNIRLNELQNVVTSINKAVAGKPGELELFFRPLDPGGVSIYQYGNKAELASVKVPAVTLADIFAENKIEKCDYLKIDCEGAEEQILQNTSKELFGKIANITLEWHYDLNKMSVDEVRAFLEGSGYSTKYNAPTLTLYATRNGKI